MHISPLRGLNGADALSRAEFSGYLPASELALLDLQADLDEHFEVMEAHLIAEEA